MASMTKFLPLLWKFLPWPLALNADILLVQWGGCVLVYPLCSDFMGGKTWHFEDPIFAIFAKIAIHSPY
jgi:hypothetical protein